MRDGVETGHRRHVFRRRQRELRIEQRDLHRCRGIAAGHLHVGRGVGDHGVALCFAPCSCRSGNTDHRQQRRRRFPVAAIIAHRAAVGQEEIDPFRAVQRAPATETDDGVEAERLREGAASLDHRAVRIGTKLGEEDRVNARSLQNSRGAGGVTGIDDTGVGHEQRTFEPQIAREVPKTLQNTEPEYDSSARTKLERNHLPAPRLQPPCEPSFEPEPLAEPSS